MLTATPGTTVDSTPASTPHQADLSFLAGGGELGALIRSHDWASTALGSPETWLQPLRTAVRLILNSGHPMYIIWGPELLCFYNDAFRPSIGPERHPSSLGQTARQVWSEVWHLIGPQIEQVVAGRGATWHESDLVPMTRNGKLEDVYWTYSYSPLDDVTAPHGVGGVLVVCAETTAAVLADRQKAEELRDREEQLRLATDAADIGLWDVDLVSDTLYWPARVKAMFGISPTDEVSMADFYAGLHPDDREATGVAFATATDPSQRAVYDVEYRTVGKEDGVIRWLAAKGRGIFDETGRCTRVIGTAIDITKRRATEESLRISEETLRDADRRKDEFLATLAHELRNPIAPIGNAAALLQHPRLDMAQVTHYGKMIERQTKVMAVLLDDLLEVSRISTGKLQLKKQVISVSSLVNAAVEPVQPTLQSRFYRLQLNVNRGETLLEADPIRLAQVLTNLLTNAIKYSDPGSEIVLRTEAVGDHIRFEIQDHGIGLSQEQIPHIFQMFAQVVPSLDRAEGGLGIGLAVARVMVEMHGGEITVASEGLGKGSTFTVVVPRGQLTTDVPGIESAKAAATTALSAYPVLVVDDNVDAAESLAAFLQFDGYTVHVAHNAERALELAREVRPVACFLDIGLPDMNGYEVAERMRAAKNGEPLFLVATTGWGRPEDRKRSMAAGFDVHMTKPMDLENASQLLAARLQDLRSRSVQGDQ